jgi:NitT/TauT family transport system ATP-binding protein
MNLPATNTVVGVEPGEMEMRGCYYSFGKGKEVLDNVSFKVEKGSFTCFCGPSGCGKSSIINLLAGYAVPDIG